MRKPVPRQPALLPALRARQETAPRRGRGPARQGGAWFPSNAFPRSIDARIVVAVPVAAPSTYEEFQIEVDEVVCVFTPEPFHAVGLWYEDFSPTTDQEVRELLERARSPEAEAVAEGVTP